MKGLKSLSLNNISFREQYSASKTKVMLLDGVKDGLIGGAIMALGSTVLLLGNGQMMGASNLMFSALLKPKETFQKDPSKLVFIGSFCMASSLWQILIEPNAMLDTGIGADRTPSTIGTVLAGFLVGFGTKLSSGCTSGHGICGLGRLSKRSFVAVCTFCGSGMIVATLLSRLSSSFLLTDGGTKSKPNPELSIAITSVAALVGMASLAKSAKKAVATSVSGALFSISLAVSKMIWPSNVIGFLQVGNIATNSYNPALMAVMATGVAFSLIGYQYKGQSSMSKPFWGDDWSGVPTAQNIDSNLVIGSALFGAGWALGGLCPGPALFAATAGAPEVIGYWMPAFVLGGLVATSQSPAAKKKV